MPVLDRRRFLKAGAAAALVPWLPACTGAEYGAGVPQSDFGPAATAEQVTAGIDLGGRTALVTGCNSGLGYETMRVLALRGAHVLGTARTMEKGERACASIEGRATPFVLELTDMASVIECANAVRALGSPLDIVVCNAGVLFSEHRQLDGIELHFLVNHLGHFLLVNRLLDRVLAAPQGRVVTVSSASHRTAPENGIRFDDLSGRGWFDRAYAHSKLANGLFAFELARRLENTSATSNALHPGRVRTNIFRNVEAPSPSAEARSPAQGAATACYLATNPALADVNGYYFVDCNPRKPSPLMLDARMADELWAASEALVADYLA